MIGPTSRQARAVLRHPDQRSAWAVVVVATTRSPVDDLDGRLQALGRALPLTSARLRADAWVAGAPPTATVVEGDPRHHPGLVARFDLASDAPVRALVGGDRATLALAAHHAAFDGLALVAIAGFLAGAPLLSPRASPTRPSAPPTGALAALRRMVRPADRVAPSPGGPHDEVLLTRTVDLTGPDVSARLAAAAVAAVGRHNAGRGARWRRIGISLGVGGGPGLANVATYRRVDIGIGENVEAAVARALAVEAEPAELVMPTRLLRLARPIVSRLSDSLLVSNVGRHPLDVLQQLEFFPVARGRSAVAVGAAGLDGGTSTVTLRTRDLGRADAEILLDDTVTSLPRR